MTRPKQLKLASLMVVAAVGLLVSGCSGINSGVGVSPASFLLPGLMMNEPQPTSPSPTTLGETNSVIVAQCP